MSIRARLNAKHIDVCARIIQEATGKISQTVRCRWHVCRSGWVGPSTGESLRRISSRKVGTVAVVILLGALQK